MIQTPAPGHATRAAEILARPDSRAFLAAPGFPLPDRTAMHRVGSSGAEDFLATGLLLRAALEDAAGLDPDDAVFDIGCGWGRLAMPLAARLGPRGRYLGMDAAAEAIAWCRRHIGEADPRFRFHHVDIRNSYANPQGRIPARAARLLPWEERFDRVVAFSLFTHLLPRAMARYLAEAARLCRPGGVFVATFFLLDDAARAAIEAGRTDRRFPDTFGMARIADPAVPEDAVAYDAAEVMALLDAAGFEAEWRPGAWCARAADPFDYQDVVIARRRGRAAGRGGTRGAVQSIAAGALRGWAWDAAIGAAPTIRLEVAGEVVAEARPDRAAAGAPPGGLPAGTPAGFALPVPPHLLGRNLRDLRVLAGPESLPLLARARMLLADPAEELAHAWRREALRHGLWRLDSLERREDGSVAGRIWAVPPRGVPARPWLFAGEARVPLAPAEGTDTVLAAALGLAPDAVRPWFSFILPAPLARAGQRLRLGEAADRPWDPGRGIELPAPVAGGPGPDEHAAVAAVREATGLSPAALAPRLDLAPDSALAQLAAAPAGQARLVLALGGLDMPAQGDEAALAGAVGGALAPGGLVVLASPGAAALLDGQGGSGRLLGWLRHGVATAPEAPPGRRVLRGRQHLEAAWGRDFEILLVQEAALSGLRDLAVLRRRAA